MIGCIFNTTNFNLKSMMNIINSDMYDKIHKNPSKFFFKKERMVKDTFNNDTDEIKNRGQHTTGIWII